MLRKIISPAIFMVLIDISAVVNATETKEDTLGWSVFSEYGVQTINTPLYVGATKISASPITLRTAYNFTETASIYFNFRIGSGSLYDEQSRSASLSGTTLGFTSKYIDASVRTRIYTTKVDNATTGNIQYTDRSNIHHNNSGYRIKIKPIIINSGDMSIKPYVAISRFAFSNDIKQNITTTDSDGNISNSEEKTSLNTALVFFTELGVDVQKTLSDAVILEVTPYFSILKYADTKKIDYDIVRQEYPISEEQGNAIGLNAKVNYILNQKTKVYGITKYRTMSGGSFNQKDTYLGLGIRYKF